jgi:hypothetical protein
MDNMIKDTSFEISAYLEEKVTNGYISLQREIDINGFILCKSDTGTVKLFSCELAVILTTKELPAYNMDTNRETQINGLDYLNTYIEGYKKGELYFEDKWSVSRDTLYGSNSEQYVRDLHSNYFHILHTGVNEGWGYVKKQFPFILTHKAIKEFGYYSGIVNKVEEQVKKYPTLFANFEKCEHNLLNQQLETDTDKLKVHLVKYGFFELPYVLKLSEPNKQSLIELIRSNKLPYTIAMFDFLGFFKHLETNYFPTKSKLNAEVSKWFNKDKDGRTIKGLINSLSDYSSEDKERYTSHLHKENVKNDYEKLK